MVVKNKNVMIVLYTDARTNDRNRKRCMFIFLFLGDEGKGHESHGSRAFPHNPPNGERTDQNDVHHDGTVQG